MSDTTKLVLWIVLALVVVALIIWFFISASRRRRVEAEQRAEAAAALRASVEERLPEFQDAEDRASVVGEIAQDARAEAEAKAAEAARLEHQAEEAAAEADAARRERETLEREADRLDPDVRTDEEGFRVDRSGRRLDGPDTGGPSAEPTHGAPAAAAGRTTDPEQQREERGAFGRPGGGPGSVAAGVALGGAEATAGAGRTSGPQAFTEDDDEPDLADAENPFAGEAGHEPDPEPVPAPVSTPAPATSAHEVPVEGEPEHPAIEHAPGPTSVGSSVSQGEASAARAEDADWVNGPVEDVDDEELQASAAAETAAADWINGPADGESTRSAGERSETRAHAGTADAEPVVAGTAAGEGGAGAVVGGTGPARTSDAREDETMTNDDADWVNGPVEDVDQQEIESSAAEETEAVDWINGPPDDEPPSSRADTDAHTDALAADPMTVEEVSVPALEDRDEVIVGGGTPRDDPGDHRGQPWSTDLTEPAGPRAGSASGVAQEPAAPDAAPTSPTATPGSSAADAEPVAERSQRPFEREERLDVEPAPEPAGSEVPPLDEPEAAGPTGAGADRAAEAQPDAGEAAPRERRMSTFDEVHDGGFGIGSAAPFDDGAQPLGHAIKGYRESSTFIAPGGPGYDDAEPDVWFFNEEAARRAGFNPAGQ